MTLRTDTPAEAARTQWDDAAEGWDAQSPALRTWLAGPTATLLDLAGIAPGHCVLDLAAGAGGQTLAIADRVGPAGHVLATDLSPALLDRLAANAARAGHATVTVRAADAQEPLARSDRFDAAVCRLGLMLMPRPDRCLAAVHAALRPGGRFAAMVFAGPDANPCLRIMMATALRHAGLPPPDPFAPGSLFSLARPGLLDGLFRAAGFREVATQAVEAPFVRPSAAGYVDFLRAAAAPVRAILAPLSPAAREAAWEDMRTAFAAFDGPDGWTGPNRLLLAAGTR